MQDKTLIIVPAYNEEQNIPIVIDEIRASLPEADILVINDCSTDRTSETVYKNSNTKLVDLPCNLGIGGAVQTGFIYAARNGYDYAVQLDGDGQHIASEVEKLITVLKEKKCDMVIGSRFLETKSFETTKIRRMGIRLFYIIYKFLFKIKITDGTSGFRAYNRKCTEFLSRHYPDDYPEPEAVVVLKKNGFEISEIGVRMRERISGKSSITPIRSVYYMVKVVLSIFISYMRS